MQLWPITFRAVPTKIATRLYALVIVAVVAIVVLATSSIYFALNTRHAAQHLYEGGLVGVVRAGQLEMLLERHRRIVEGAPVEFDRVSIDRDRRETEEILEQLTVLANADEDYYLNTIGELLPNFTDHSRRVLFHVAQFAQDGALLELAKYIKSADRIATQIKRFRRHRLETADRNVNTLSATAKQLLRWVSIWAAVAVVIIGPLSFLIVRSITVRLNDITVAMRKLANNETDIVVPSVAERDEIGDMARALQVFKTHAIAILSQRRELKALNFRFDVALNNMDRGLSMYDKSEKLVVANKTFHKIYDIPEKLHATGTPFRDILRHRGTRGHMLGEDGRRDLDQWHMTYSSKVASGTPFDVTYLTNTGRTILITYQPLGDGGCVALHEDITEKRQAAEKIKRLAQQDALTGLANRYYFRQTLKRSLAGLDQQGSQDELAVLLIDLDWFKEVNDTLGHPTGDALLKSVAGRLKMAVRSTDFVARLGGDEFAILLPGVTDETTAVMTAERIRQSLTAPYFVNGSHVTIGASIGIVLAPSHGTNHDEVLKKVDIALYRAKDDGRSQVRIFEDALEARLREKRLLETELQQAMAGDQLELHYQPILDLKTERVTSCEALMRWCHPVRGFVSPAQFIPLAEDIGLISKFGAWALERACKEAMSWRDDVAVSVNLSAVQFGDGDLYSTVQSALKKSSLPAHRLHLEVTESVLLDNSNDTRTILHKLRADGVKIALDDFGTGYASLSYLRSFPFDKIKIDQSFVRVNGDAEQSVAIVRAVADLAQTLGMQTVAEGVETNTHLARVIDAGCSEVQGYLFSKPVPGVDVPRVISECYKQLHIAA